MEAEGVTPDARNEHHLSRVYAKFGVRSRAELTAVFARAETAAAA